MNQKLRDYVKKHLHVTRFDKDKLSYLSLEINNNIESGITTISQHHYIKELLKKCNIDYKICKYKRTVTTPSTIDFFKETDTDTTGIDQKQYRSTIMALMFAAKRTRSDILLHVTYLSSYCGHATRTHVNRLQRILLYLAGTVNRCIVIKQSTNLDINLNIFADAGHLTHQDMKGHTGVLLQFNNNFVLAFSKKQILFSESSCESELYAAHTGGLLAKWVVNFFEELKIKIVLPILFFQDNQSTIKLSSKGYGDFMRTKHIKKRYYSIRDLELNNIIKQ